MQSPVGIPELDALDVLEVPLDVPDIALDGLDDAPAPAPAAPPDAPVPLALSPPAPADDLPPPHAKTKAIGVIIQPIVRRTFDILSPS